MANSHQNLKNDSKALTQEQYQAYEEPPVNTEEKVQAKSSKKIVLPIPAQAEKKLEDDLKRHRIAGLDELPDVNLDLILGYLYAEENKEDKKLDAKKADEKVQYEYPRLSFF